MPQKLPDTVRAQFPALHQEVHGHLLAYLDNAATTQKPLCVLEAMDNHYRLANANVRRGVHELSRRATESYEAARESVKEFIGAAHSSEIIFTKGATESINLVANSWGRKNLHAGDELVLSVMEHHSNIVPWQLVAEERGAKIRTIPVTESGELELDALRGLLTERTKLVGVVHVSNALGTVNDVGSIIRAAHSCGAKVLVDGAQSAAHLPIDVQQLDVDFYALSSHKSYGPTGVGVLYGKETLLEEMPPYQGGGDMIKSVTFERSSYDELPHKFEAGTPNIAGVVGYGAAVRFMLEFDVSRMAQHEERLAALARERLAEIPGVRVVGGAKLSAGIVSFVLDGVHPHDIGSVLDHEGVAIRTGHHCCMPLMSRFGIPGTARASFAAYNTEDEVARLVSGVEKAHRMLGADLR